MQTHTCKPKNLEEPRDFAGNDTRFYYDEQSQRIASFAFEGFCMQALIASELTVFALLECSDHPRQRLIFNSESETIHLAEDMNRCVGVVPETVPAGPWVKKPLTLQACDELPDSLKQWTLVSEQSQ